MVIECLLIVVDHQIMADLLAYEGGHSRTSQDEEEAKYSSSDEEDISDMSRVGIVYQSDSGESSEEEYTVQVSYQCLYWLSRSSK